MLDVMDMRIDSTIIPQQSAVISHRQIMAVRLLQTPSQELAATIARERDTNPAFEAEERESCRHCGAGLDTPGSPCGVCGMSPSATADRVHESLADMDGAAPAWAVQYDDDGADPMMRVAASTGCGEGLLQMLQASVSAADAEIAEYLVGSLDHHGYLPARILEDAAQALGCDRVRVEHVLVALQRMDPPGIGARGARECMLIQLSRLADMGQRHPLAERLVAEHLPLLAFRHFRDVARHVGSTPKAVEAEWQFIREHLHPYPAHGFDPDFGTIGSGAQHIRPDVVIRRRGGTFEVEVVERGRYELHVNREYLWARSNLAEVGSNDAERLHVRSYVEQAQSFISALRQRWETMKRVSEALIDMQRAFLEHGQSALKPLTRADVARRLTLHESTVSRATDGKYVLLPNGKTVPFDDFFDSSLPVKKALRELIADENPRRPFSDEQLTRLLEKRGFAIARRTIAKYREEEGILPSRLRRSHVVPERVRKAVAVGVGR